MNQYKVNLIFILYNLYRGRKVGVKCEGDRDLPCQIVMKLL